jgi:hypothetical protein
MAPLPLRRVFLLLVLAACAAEREPPPITTAVAPDRPLDGADGDPVAVRTAVLIEAALAQVRPQDLRRCLDEFSAGSPGPFRPPALATWLIVASALPVDGATFQRRRAAAPELNPEPDDGWQDRVVYRVLLRPPDRADSAVACLSCVFDHEDGQLAYRRAHALDTCRRAVPPERDLATVVPLG